MNKHEFSKDTTNEYDKLNGEKTLKTSNLHIHTDIHTHTRQTNITIGKRGNLGVEEMPLYLEIYVYTYTYMHTHSEKMTLNQEREEGYVGR